MKILESLATTRARLFAQFRDNRQVAGQIQIQTVDVASAIKDIGTAVAYIGKLENAMKLATRSHHLADHLARTEPTLMAAMRDALAWHD